MRILGIDPGSSSVGFGIIEVTGDKLAARELGTIKIAERDPAKKLLEIYLSFKRLLTSQPIDFVGIEKLFFSKNTKTAMEVAEARGVIVLCLLLEKLPFVELSPNEVKLAVTNYGASDKKAVAKMVSLLLSLPAQNLDDNTTDALAVAIAASRQITLIHK